MKEILKLIAVLTLICAASGSLMSFVYDITKEPIRLAKLRNERKAVEDVLPPNDDMISVVLTNGEKTVKVFVAKQNGCIKGFATKGTSPEGYGGDINVMVGFATNNVVTGISILKPLYETPGLGANIENEGFTKRFANKPINIQWAVRKDEPANREAIEGITAATISSRAVVGAVEDAIATLKEQEPAVRARVTALEAKQ